MGWKLLFARTGWLETKKVLGEPIWDRNIYYETATAKATNVLGEPIWDGNQHQEDIQNWYISSFR